MVTWNDLPSADTNVSVPPRIEQQMARALCVPRSSLGVLTDFAAGVVEDGEEVLTAFRVTEINVHHSDRSTSRIFAGGRGAPIPIVLVTTKRIVFGRYKLGLRTKDSNWSWTDLALFAAKSVSPVRRGRFEIELPTQQETARLIFELWMFRLSRIRSIRDAVAGAVGGCPTFNGDLL